MNEEVKNVFNPGPMISFRGARKLNSYLVRAKLYPLERSVGSFKCRNRRCQVCDNVTAETTTFKSSVTSNEYKINHSFNCNEKCLIYLFAKHVKSSMLVRPVIVSNSDGIITKTITESF